MCSMTSAWFLQAKPELYDVDGALQALREISWRIRQHRKKVKANDIAVIWRSGVDAGIVGVGRIVTDPEVRAYLPEEQPFTLDEQEFADMEPRVLLHSRPVEWIPKSEVRTLEGFSAHQIVTFPV